MRFKLFFILLSLNTVFTNAQPAYKFHEQGVEKLNKANYIEAVKDFDKAIAKDKNEFESFTDRGRCQYALGKRDLALADYSQAIKLNPLYQQAYYYRGIVYSDMNKDKEAIADFSKMIQLQPAFTDAHVKRGMLYFKGGQNDLALIDLNKSIEQITKDAKIFAARGSIYKALNKNEESVKDYSQAISIDPNYVDAYYNRGLVLAKLKKHPQAVADFTKCVELKMNTEDLFLQRAASNLSLGKQEEALKDFNTLIDVMKTKNTAILNSRGLLLLQKGDGVGAAKDFSKTLIIDKTDFFAYCQRGNAYLKQGKAKYPLAVNDFNKAIELKSDNADGHFGLGSAYFESAKYEQAVEALNKAIKLKPSADAYYIRGKCNFKLNNKKGMCDDFSVAESMGSKDAKKDALLMCNGR